MEGEKETAETAHKLRQMSVVAASLTAVVVGISGGDAVAVAAAAAATRKVRKRIGQRK